ncbi:hypothetical protein QYF36_025518 [Acer negundo]|nr:hypothetical protein QYF36_025518 [Acer negundo]
MADKEVTKYINPLTVSIENVTLNATVETGLETAKEDADATETGSPSHDMESFQGSETDDDQYEAEIQELQIEERVSVLEKIFADKRHDDVGNGQFGDGEYSSCHCQKLSSPKVVNEADKIVVPLTELIEKQNELVERRLETALEDAIGSKTGSTSNDMERSLGVEGDGNEHESDIKELQIEDWVSRLERSLQDLKQQDFVINSPPLH